MRGNSSEMGQSTMTPEADWRRSDGFMRYVDKLANLPVLDSRLALLIAIVIAAGPVWLIITTPVGLFWQAVFAVGSFALCSWLRRYEGHLISICLMMISLLTSFRYFYWRVTETIGFGVPGVTYVDLFFAIGLILAEFYAVLVLILGYFQVLWPLHRRPYPLPEDTDEWPTVDVFIPTYNEPLEVVRPTVLAAMQMDWPEDKMNVYVLDDGCRDEFGDFCREVGVTHLPRKESTHAKAGNINKALTKTSGDLITIFDCDHIPTRSFLQVSVGWFLKDPRMALVQLPHHFFSPDPFERNLGTFKQVPNEGELFYGLLQDGNDFWDATFFCGSCAVLRREALEEVGGVAVETVTEDAHTALKMHRRGWRSAYINVAQAAGLATESLSAHIGQRIRWARGMAQIFRTDNPFLKRGLRFGQRLCYANAMLHFFYGLPRIVFLSAPLSYLLFDAKIIQAQALMIAAYALPHLLIANMTNSRLQGPFRHSFWAEVYETVLASYITAPTLLAIINPKLGSFNVTAKGGIVEHEYFDQKMAIPYLILVAANLGGVIIGIGRLFFWSTHEIDTVILNMSWSVYNLIIIGAALAVAWESKQVRRTIRVESDLEAEVTLPDGTRLSARTLDLSEGGCAVRLERPTQLPMGSEVWVQVLPSTSDIAWDCRVTRSVGDTLSVQFEPLDIEQEKHLLHCIFGRADAWVTWAQNRDVDHPGRAFLEVLSFGYYGVYRVIEMYLGRFWSGLVGGATRLVRRVTATGAMLALATSLLAIAPDDAQAQTQQAKRNTTLPTVTRTLDLQELSGIQDSIRLRGIQGEISLPVSVRDDEVITQAQMTLRYAHSPSLVFELSHINVFVNTELVTTIPLSEETASGGEHTFNIDPRLFVRYNTILLQFIGHYTYDCEDPAHTSLWANISKNSSLTLTTQPLLLANELNLLPQPFFDRRDQSTLELPFVFASEPSIEEMKAAGIVASWFGAQAAYRGAKFPVILNGELPEGHAVVIGGAGARVGGYTLPSNGTSTVSMVNNPRNNTSKLLVVSGASPEGMITAAKALSLGAEALAGETAVIRSLEEPKPREPYDAPRWVPTDRPVLFSELVSSRDLEVRGLYPDLIRVNFHVPPDLYAWESDGVPMELKYRYTPTIGPKSTLNVNINNEFVDAIPLASDNDSNAAGGLKRRIQIPFLSELDSVNETKVNIPYFKITGSNQLQFHYFFERQKQDRCKDVVLDNLRGVVDPGSKIDFSDFPHYTALPELSLFANGGYPYSRLADMSETAIALPSRLGTSEIATYLALMGHLGNSTGYPATRVTLTQGADTGAIKGKNVLVLGSAGNQPLLEQWADDMPLSLVGGTARLRVIGPIERLLGRWRGYDLEAAVDHAGQVLLEAGDALGAMMSFESPVSSEKTVVVLTAGQDERLLEVANLLLDPGDRQFLQGDLVLLNGSEINHYRLGTQYKVGRLPLIMALKHWFSTKPLGMLILMLIIALIVAAVLYRTLRRMAIARHEGKR